MKHDDLQRVSSFEDEPSLIELEGKSEELSIPKPDIQLFPNTTPSSDTLNKQDEEVSEESNQPDLIMTADNSKKSHSNTIYENSIEGSDKIDKEEDSENKFSSVKHVDRPDTAETMAKSESQTNITLNPTGIDSQSTNSVNTQEKQELEDQGTEPYADFELKPINITERVKREQNSDYQHGGERDRGARPFSWYGTSLLQRGSPSFPQITRTPSFEYISRTQRDEGTTPDSEYSRRTFFLHDQISRNTKRDIGRRFETSGRSEWRSAGSTDSIEETQSLNFFRDQHLVRMMANKQRVASKNEKRLNKGIQEDITGINALKRSHTDMDIKSSTTENPMNHSKRAGSAPENLSSGLEDSNTSSNHNRLSSLESHKSFLSRISNTQSSKSPHTPSFQMTQDEVYSTAASSHISPNSQKSSQSLPICTESSSPSYKLGIGQLDKDVKRKIFEDLELDYLAIREAVRDLEKKVRKQEILIYEKPSPVTSPEKRKPLNTTRSQLFFKREEQADTESTDLQPLSAGSDLQVEPQVSSKGVITGSLRRPESSQGSSEMIDQIIRELEQAILTPEPLDCQIEDVDDKKDITSAVAHYSYIFNFINSPFLTITLLIFLTFCIFPSLISGTGLIISNHQ